LERTTLRSKRASGQSEGPFYYLHSKNLRQPGPLSLSFRSIYLHPSHSANDLSV
jgi:hypothetical protein